MGFEPTISAGERPQTYAFDRAARDRQLNLCRLLLLNTGGFLRNGSAKNKTVSYIHPDKRNIDVMSARLSHLTAILLLHLLLPLALQPTVGFGLSNNVLPFFPICHQLSSSSQSQHLKISFYFLFPSFPVSSPSSRPFQFLSEDLIWASYPPPFSLGDLTSLPFALLSILLYFLLCSFLLVLDSSDFSIPRFHI